MTSRPPVRRQRLATRIALLSVGVAVLTAIIAGVVSVGLIRNNGADAAQRTLRRLADVTQAVFGSNPQGRGKVPVARLNRALSGLGVQSGVIGPAGNVLTRSSLVRNAVDPSDISSAQAGNEVHATRTVNGNAVFVEVRPTTNGGGIVLAQRRVDAVKQDEQAIDRILIALAIAGVLAAVIGLLVAWRLARPLRRTAAAAHSLAGGNRDVTLPAQGPSEVVEVSDAINTLAGALRHSEQRQRDFLLSVSHDLRTPLTAISGYAESLADDVIPQDQTAYVGGVVLGEAKRLERLVGDLLDLARLDARDFRVDLAAVDLTALARDAGLVWQTRAAASGVEFRLEIPDAAVWSDTDATRVRQVLDGLFDNALRVTPSGAPIVLAARVDQGRAVVEVRDGGPGLHDDDLAVAFEQGVLYERYRGVRQVGTGLGLAIVAGLVRRLGGTVTAGHAPEGGACFTVHLPLAQPR